VVGSREGTIYRITPRRNDEVNDTWMPDSGRVLYKVVDADERLNAYAINGRPAKAEEAIEAAAELLREGKLAIVASGRLSVEEQYLLTRIRKELGGSIPTFLVGRVATGDGKLLSADRNPNVRGALLTGLIDAYPEARLDALNAMLKDGSVKTVLAVGEDITGHGIDPEAFTDARLLYVGVTHANCTQFAAVEIPLLTVFEKSGSLVNQQFRVQKFTQAVPGPAGVLHGLSTFTRLLNCLNADAAIAPSAAAVWKVMQADVPEFAGVAFDRIPSTGLVVSGERFAGIPFVEDKGLHFEPKHALAEA
jgi:NADH-quinone oxidoreductase subunit G